METSRRDGGKQDGARPQDDAADAPKVQLPAVVEDFRPFIDFARRQAQSVEERFFRGLRDRLDRFAGDAVARPRERIARTAAQVFAEGERSAGHVLAALLERSLDQRPEKAERELLLRIAEQLSTDEARIIGALSDGRNTACCHVSAVSGVGIDPLRVLSYASRVGVDAGVMLAEQVPVYLDHLLGLGVLQAGPADKALAGQYDMLESDRLVRETVKYLTDDCNVRARVTRFTMRLSPLGRKLWEAGEACRQD